MGTSSYYDTSHSSASKSPDTRNAQCEIVGDGLSQSVRGAEGRLSREGSCVDGCQKGDGTHKSSRHHEAAGNPFLMS